MNIQDMEHEANDLLRQWQRDAKSLAACGQKDWIMGVVWGMQQMWNLVHRHILVPRRHK